jgi:hypothetical protein
VPSVENFDLYKNWYFWQHVTSVDIYVNYIEIWKEFAPCIYSFQGGFMCSIFPWKKSVLAVLEVRLLLQGLHICQDVLSKATHLIEVYVYILYLDGKGG